MSNWEKDEALQRFREYLRIPSVHPDVDYGDCVIFLKRQAAELNLPVAVYELVPGKPVLVITWGGTRPDMTSILLNSHMDVVPVYEEYWTYPPFEAHIDEKGYIYARGTQDMKCVGMAYLEAVRSLKKKGVRLMRTVHICFVPDEEIGSEDGMKKFSVSKEFNKLNIGFALDESAPFNEEDTLKAFYGEKTTRQIKVICRGEPGHGSLLSAGSAGEKFHYIIDKFMTLRAQELKKVQSGTWVGDVISINLNQVEGGVQVNVVPDTLSVSFDIRIPPDVDHDEFEKMIHRWCQEAGDNVRFEYISKNPLVESTKIDGSVPFFTALKDAINDMGITLKVVICPGATDARFVRLRGIPAINITPFDRTPTLLHAHDERIHVDVYKRGLQVMERMVQAVANQQ